MKIAMLCHFGRHHFFELMSRYMALSGNGSADWTYHGFVLII